MIVYEVEPLAGIGPVRLGMTRSEVRREMGDRFETQGGRQQVDSYHNEGFQIFYGQDETVEFIELTRESGFAARVYGIEVFTHTAREVLDTVCRYSTYNPDDLEVGYSYVFPDIEFSLWRPSMPESEDDEEGKYFSTVGVGIRGYYSDTIKS